MKKIILSIMLFCSIFFPLFSLAHPGRTDSSGCHTCRTNCASWGLSTGEYHCHRAKTLPQPLEPIKSHKVEGGMGYTTPAPEYKIPKIEGDKNANINIGQGTSKSILTPDYKTSKIEKSNNTTKQDISRPQEKVKPFKDDNRIGLWGRVLSFFGWH